ncbi:MAG TPA: tripartite tricarboxylate transporter TctB family protein [Alphaproteobacteria bacterium]|jgi:putative tricarboxylic transport membrane protein|nr:tripartite tricarboxylate transporter TctB family protein [Alphaproteobacteria bacterium]
MTSVNPAQAAQRSGFLRQALARVRSPQDLAAGLFLIAISIFAFWQSAELSMGTLRQLGPGMVPHALAVLLALCGVILAFNALRHDGPTLERWAMRGPVFVFGAAIVFAIAIRPLGLAVAGPLLIILSGMASHETRWRETLVFGIAMTAFCLVLFRLLLSLPIPVAPWLIGY